MIRTNGRLATGASSAVFQVLSDAYIAGTGMRYM